MKVYDINNNSYFNLYILINFTLSGSESETDIFIHRNYSPNLRVPTTLSMWQ